MASFDCQKTNRITTYSVASIDRETSAKSNLEETHLQVNGRTRLSINTTLPQEVLVTSSE